ncbi:MAG: hypothetical protein LCH30_00825 [Proteobacteria bacterium]|nr:hypothetical protein [Pseudomonadota bacterium]
MATKEDIQLFMSTFNEFFKGRKQWINKFLNEGNVDGANTFLRNFKSEYWRKLLEKPGKDSEYSSQQKEALTVIEEEYQALVKKVEEAVAVKATEAEKAASTPKKGNPYEEEQKQAGIKLALSALQNLVERRIKEINSLLDKKDYKAAEDLLKNFKADYTKKRAEIDKPNSQQLAVLEELENKYQAIITRVSQEVAAERQAIEDKVSQEAKELVKDVEKIAASMKGFMEQVIDRDGKLKEGIKPAAYVKIEKEIPSLFEKYNELYDKRFKYEFNANQSERLVASNDIYLQLKDALDTNATLIREKGKEYELVARKSMKKIKIIEDKLQKLEAYIAKHSNSEIKKTAQDLIDSFKEDIKTMRTATYQESGAGFLKGWAAKIMEQQHILKQDSGAWDTFINFFRAIANVFKSKSDPSSFFKYQSKTLEQFDLFTEEDENPDAGKPGVSG